MDRPVFVPSVAYREPEAARPWLERAFGFETTTLVTDAEGRMTYCEMSFEGAVLTLSGHWDGPPMEPARLRSPAVLEGVNTQFIRVELQAGIDEHCERARATGAVIVAEPEDQFYGHRVYRALDPEGHVWNFAQAVRAVSREDQEAASGLRIETAS